MYVCICQAITDRQIERAVDAGIDSVEGLRDTLGVASCCGSCMTTAEEILAERKANRALPSPQIYRPATQAV
ncbi:MAG: (2Fe-2S)-binding protein [Pseudomonadota bacterium]